MKPNNRTDSFLLTLLLTSLVVISPAEEDPYAASGWEKISDLENLAKIEKSTGSPAPIPILTIEQPGVTRSRHLLAGEVRYRDVSGTGFLEMWTYYGETEFYFSRTLGEVGPMAKLSGSSEWRGFILPFNGKDDVYPTRLKFNLILPGGGTVELRNLRLYQKAGETDQAWWVPELKGTVGGMTGMTFGLLCGLSLLLAAKGKARTFAVVALTLSLSLAGAVLLAGIAAALMGQPGHVTAPLLIPGVLGVIVSAVIFFRIGRMYLNHELQLIAAAG